MCFHICRVNWYIASAKESQAWLIIRTTWKVWKIHRVNPSQDFLNLHLEVGVKKWGFFWNLPKLITLFMVKSMQWNTEQSLEKGGKTTCADMERAHISHTECVVSSHQDDLVINIHLHTSTYMCILYAVRCFTRGTCQSERRPPEHLCLVWSPWDDHRGQGRRGGIRKSGVPRG